MTESEWLTGIDPEPMLEYLKGKVSDRKLRLFAVACCRRIWQFVTDPECRQLVEIIERSADGLVEQREILNLNYDRLTDDCGKPEEPYRMAFMVAGHVGYSLLTRIHGFSQISDDFEDTLETAKGAVYTMAVSYPEPDDKNARYYDSETLVAVHRKHQTDAAAEFQERQASEKVRQCSLLRCIFGKPLRPGTLDHSNLTPTTVNLAQEIYDTTAFDRLPVLAETLEAAGCDNPEILTHCREPGPHVKGCWVVDAVLRKE